MKRWLVASLAMNLVMIGVFVGYFGAAITTFASPPLPPPPMKKDWLLTVVEKTVAGFEDDRRQGALKIIETVKASYADRIDQVRLPPQRSDGLLVEFVAGELPRDLPEMRSVEEFHALRAQRAHELFYQLQFYLTPDERTMIAQALRDHFRVPQGL